MLFTYLPTQATYVDLEIKDKLFHPRRLCLLSPSNNFSMKLQENSAPTSRLCMPRSSALAQKRERKKKRKEKKRKERAGWSQCWFLEVGSDICSVR
jgi:hypothetical protein